MKDVARIALVAAVVLSAACAEDPPDWCFGQGEPLTDCAGPQCVAALVIDYKRLEPRGYRIFALSGEWIDRQQAETLAHDHVVGELGAAEPDVSDCVRADDFYHCVLPYRETGDQYLVVIHAPSGTLLFSGLEVWADIEKRGYDFPLPEGFLGPEAVRCVPSVPPPQKQRLVTTSSPMMGQAIPSTAEDALSLARKINITRRFVEGSSYNALVISYGPAIGEFDAESGDWYVWLHRVTAE